MATEMMTMDEDHDAQEYSKIVEFDGFRSTLTDLDRFSTLKAIRSTFERRAQNGVGLGFSRVRRFLDQK